MRSIFKICLYSLLSLSLTFCGMFSKKEEASEAEIPRYENYHSSGVYKDIEGESRSVSSTEYMDDDYGDVEADSAQDVDMIVGGLNEESPEAEDSKYDPLPVEKISEPKPIKKKRAVAMPKFKNGMHRASVNCTMRAKASTKSKSVGKVRKGKKLWMENHNKNWVKVFKKSGPVYINKLCL